MREVQVVDRKDRDRESVRWCRKRVAQTRSEVRLPAPLRALHGDHQRWYPLPRAEAQAELRKLGENMLSHELDGVRLTGLVSVSYLARWTNSRMTSGILTGFERIFG